MSSTPSRKTTRSSAASLVDYSDSEAGSPALSSADKRQKQLLTCPAQELAGLQKENSPGQQQLSTIAEEAAPTADTTAGASGTSNTVAAAPAPADVSMSTPGGSRPSIAPADSPQIPSDTLIVVQPSVPESEDDAGDDSPNTIRRKEFSWWNSSNHEACLLDMNMPNLKGQLKNANLAIDTATNKLKDTEPKALIAEKQKEMRNGELADTGEMAKEMTTAINLATTYVKTLEKLGPAAKKVACDLVEKANVHHISARKELEEAEKWKEKVEKAMIDVGTKEADAEAEKKKEKVRKYVEESAKKHDAEHSDVARGKRKRIAKQRAKEAVGASSSS